MGKRPFVILGVRHGNEAGVWRRHPFAPAQNRSDRPEPELAPGPRERQAVEQNMLHLRPTHGR
eukprot:1059764-Alexandrium_andersonii.AAC.1